LDAHIQQQEQQLQAQASSASSAGEVEALRSQILHLTGELARKDGELQSLHRTVAQKLEQVKQVIAKKDAQIKQLQSQSQQRAASK
jgi:hypothetical protein